LKNFIKIKPLSIADRGILDYVRIARPHKRRRITILRRVVVLPLSSFTPTKFRVSIKARIE